MTGVSHESIFDWFEYLKNIKLTVALLVIHDWPEEIDKQLENLLNFRLIFFSTSSDALEMDGLWPPGLYVKWSEGQWAV